jgi:hypothetical protein
MTPTAIIDVLSSAKIKEMEEKEKRNKEIMNEIEKLEDKLKNVKGVKCLVYSRVVGYMSPTINWNAGKFQEWSERVVFELDNQNVMKG